MGDEEVAGLLTSGNDNAEGPQKTHHDRAGSDSIDHDKGEATGGGHASDGDVVEGDLAGPQLSEDNDLARDPPGDEQSTRGESRATNGLEIMQGAPGTGKIRGVSEIDAFSGVAELGPGSTAEGYPISSPTSGWSSF